MKACEMPLRLGLLVALVLVLDASAARAKCQDRPKPGVDWSKCDKGRLILRGSDLSGAILERTERHPLDPEGPQVPPTRTTACAL